MALGVRDSRQYSVRSRNLSQGVTAYLGSSISMTRFTTSLLVSAVSRDELSMRLILDNASNVTNVLYRMGSTPSTARGTPIKVMMSVAL